MFRERKSLGMSRSVKMRFWKILFAHNPKPAINKVIPEVSVSFTGKKPQFHGMKQLVSR